MATVFLRTLIIFTLLLTGLRLIGKRQVGEMQLSELVTTFMISELASSPIQDMSIPLSYALVPLILLLCGEVVISFLITKSNMLKKLFFGNPSFIIKKGVLDQRELSRLRIGIGELLSELRLKDISDINQVEYAILEQNGKLSVFTKSEESIKNKESGELSHALIMDGHINYSNLSLCAKSEKWVKGYLSRHRLNIKDVFLMTCTDTGTINIIMKEEK